MTVSKELGAPELLNRLFKPQELADFLGVPISFVYDRTCKRTADPIPHIKVGKYVRFDADQVEQWLAGRSEMPSGSRDRESQLKLTSTSSVE